MPELPALLLAAYPDRVAKRANAGANRVSWQGGGAALSEHSVFYNKPGQNADNLCVAYAVRGVSGRGRSGTTVDGVAVIDLDLLREVYPKSLSEGVECQWNEHKQRVEAARILRFGSLILRYEPGSPVPPIWRKHSWPNSLNAFSLRPSKALRRPQISGYESTGCSAMPLIYRQ